MILDIYKCFDINKCPDIVLKIIKIQISNACLFINKQAAGK